MFLFKVDVGEGVCEEFFNVWECVELFELILLLGIGGNFVSILLFNDEIIEGELVSELLLFIDNLYLCVLGWWIGVLLLCLFMEFVMVMLLCGVNNCFEFFLDVMKVFGDVVERLSLCLFFFVVLVI